MLSSEHNAGLNPTTLESWPDPKSRVRHSTNRTTQVPLSLGFYRYSLSSWGISPFFVFYWVCIINGYWILSNSFSASTDTMIFFSPDAMGYLRWFSNLFILFYFIYLERGHARKKGRDRERDGDGDRESQAGSMLSAQSPTWSSNSRTREIMTWAKIKSQTLNRLSHPSAPDDFKSWTSLHIWSKSHLVMTYNSFYTLFYLLVFLKEFFICVQERSCNVFICLWYYGNAGLKEWVKNYFLCLYFLVEMVNWYNFFFKCSVGFTSEPGTFHFRRHSDSFVFFLHIWIVSKQCLGYDILHLLDY